MLCSCGHESTSYVVRQTSRGQHTLCRRCTRPQSRTLAANPFASLRLEHVHDEQGQPVEVSSLSQLYSAEKHHHFRSLVANEREADFDKPPQTTPTSAFDAMTREERWLYPDVAEQMLAEMREAGELS